MGLQNAYLPVLYFDLCVLMNSFSLGIFFRNSTKSTAKQLMMCFSWREMWDVFVLCGVDIRSWFYKIIIGLSNISSNHSIVEYSKFGLQIYN